MRNTLFLLTFTLLACDRDAATRRPASTPPVPETATKSVDPSREISPLVSRLDYEAKHRPTSGVTAERVLDAIAPDLHVVARRQYLGATLRARYCAGGESENGMAVAVCEYADEAAAAAGKQLMDQRFAAMASTTTRATHANTVLTISGDESVIAMPAVQRALHAFATL